MSFLLLLSLSLSWGACSQEKQCKESEHISHYTLDPNGSICERDCQCNNLFYTAKCIKGICVAFERNTCKNKGEKRLCFVHSNFGGNCRSGIQECQPYYLQDYKKWGDCEPNCGTCKFGKTQPCYTGSGDSLHYEPCRAGLQKCKNNKHWGDCIGEVLPKKEEICNKIDDDCNGKIDDHCKQKKICKKGDTQPCLAKEAKGICQKGLQICLDNKWGVCEPSKPEKTEQCDGKDHDCDGQVDEGCVCDVGDVRFCGGKGVCRGVQQCGTNKKWKSCKGGQVSTTERCDGKDNNCNGQVDEGLSRCVTTIVTLPISFKDGSAFLAKFDQPYDIVRDSHGNLYVVDSANDAIRKIDVDGNVTTIARTETFARPYGITIDSDNNLYVADTFNNKIKKIDTKGNVTTVAGSTKGYKNGKGQDAQFNHPYAITIDAKKNLYVSDTFNHKIRKIDKDGNVTTVAGGSQGYKNGKGSNAQFFFPRGLAFDSQDNLYVADTFNNRIRKIDKDGNVTTFAGSSYGDKDGKGISAKFANPNAIVIDSQDNLYVADTFNHKIRKIDIKGNVTTFAGTSQGYKNGQAIDAQFNNPRGMTIDSDNNIYIADTFNHKIRKIDANKKVFVIAGNLLEKKRNKIKFAYPRKLLIDSDNNIYVADTSNSKIRKIDADGNVTTFAGFSKGYQNGKKLLAKFSSPYAITYDSRGYFYVADTFNNKIKKIDVDGNVTTFAGSSQGNQDGLGTDAQFNHPSGITIDAKGNFYVADSLNNRIRKIDKDGNVTTLAGSSQGDQDGVGQKAQFYNPQDLTIDFKGNLYVADTSNNRIRKIDVTGHVTTIAGSNAGDKDGLGIDAQFSHPSGITIDSKGNLYVSDTFNNTIRQISP